MTRFGFLASGNQERHASSRLTVARWDERPDVIITNGGTVGDIVAAFSEAAVQIYHDLSRSNVARARVAGYLFNRRAGTKASTQLVSALRSVASRRTRARAAVVMRESSRVAHAMLTAAVISSSIQRAADAASRETTPTSSTVSARRLEGMEGTSGAHCILSTARLPSSATRIYHCLSDQTRFRDNARG